jgi:hypothetical protein
MFSSKSAVGEKEAKGVICKCELHFLLGVLVFIAIVLPSEVVVGGHQDGLGIIHFVVIVSYWSCGLSSLLGSSRATGSRLRYAS